MKRLRQEFANQPMPIQPASRAVSRVVSPPKRLIFVLIATLILPLGALVLLETLLRLTGFGVATDLLIADRQDNRYLRHNPHFTWPYFGSHRLREPYPLYVTRTPAPNTVRIVILGASAAQGDPEPAFSVARILETGLNLAYPMLRFECLNLAITAVNSHVVRRVAREARALAPHAVIVYLGNNEVIGPFGPTSSATLAGHLPPRFVAAVRRSRLAQLVDRYKPKDPTTHTWEGMAQFLNHQIGVDHPALDRVYRDFEANLSAILNTFNERQTLRIVSTVAVNISEQPPFAGKSALDAFLAGQSLVDRGETALAYRKLDFAKEHDLLRFRADNAINSVVRRVAANTDSQFVHAERVFNSPEFMAGPHWFLEHVHLTFSGNHRLASLFHEALTPLIATSLAEAGSDPGLTSTFPDEPVLRMLLGFNSYEEYRLAIEMSDRFAKPPFRDQLGNSGRLARFQNLASEARTQFSTRTGRDLIMHQFDAALRAAPSDWVLRRNYANALKLYGRHSEAVEILSQLVQQFPESTQLHAMLGGSLLDSGQPIRAEQSLRTALKLKPAHLSVASDLAVALLAQRKSVETRAVIAHVSKFHHKLPSVFDYLRFESYLIDKPQSAPQVAEQLIANEPDVSYTKHRLGLLYARHGFHDSALTLFREAAAADPENTAIQHAIRNLQQGVDSQ
jgi:tetratricopeptide (TPR) repeat protein